MVHRFAIVPVRDRRSVETGLGSIGKSTTYDMTNVHWDTITIPTSERLKLGLKYGAIGFVVFGGGCLAIFSSISPRPFEETLVTSFWIGLISCLSCRCMPSCLELVPKT
jgi:hypothetical protein